MKILVTGAAGFIGFHLSRQLMARGDTVIGFDSVDDYYDPSLKWARLELLKQEAGAGPGEFHFVHANLADQAAVNQCFADYAPERVVNLAAQAGVRYSLENPHSYVESNVVGFTNILEACRYHEVQHLTYASTSSVYGANTQMPFSESHTVAHPLQFYAATKLANEHMAHSYSNLFNLPTTGLRFFTVYGPWGRPDMALFKFTRNILAGEPIPVFNKGNHTRDFTYVDDIVAGVIRANDQVAEPDPNWRSDAPDPATSSAPYRLYNIGNNNPVKLIEYIEAIEEALGMKADMDLLPLQPGDVPDTYADSTKLQEATGYKPDTPVKEGVRRFVEWYREYYNT